MLAEQFRKILHHEVMPKVETAMQERGNQAIKHITDALNVPVGRDASGRVVTRSKPGEPPRRETGALRAGVGSEVDEKNLEVSMVVYVKREAFNEEDPIDVAITLEFGIGISGPRPYMRPEYYRVKRTLGQDIAKEFS